MFPHFLVLPLLLLLCSLTPSHVAATVSVEYLEVTHSLPTDHQTPTCSLTVFELEFDATGGSSVFSGNYTPPAAHCSPPWSAVVAELSASIVGDQDKRIAALWIGGVEILRTSTVETVGHGAVWKVRTDVTRYSSLLSRSNSATPVSVIFKDVFKDSVAGILRSSVSGTFRVNVSLLFYGGGENGFKSEGQFESLGDESRELGLSAGKSGFPWKENSQSESSVESGENLRLPSEGRNGAGAKRNHFHLTPADLIIPISDVGSNGAGSWFVIRHGSDIHSKEIKIPNNAYKATLEIYVSAHASEEFWYSNPPNTYLQKKNPAMAPVNGAFRQVFAVIDSLYVGSVLPFPVVYSGGINPAFWDPVVAIGAFDLPTYELDLTPFLGLLLDGDSHSIGLGVSDSTSFWLVDANLHLWLDQKSPHVTAKLVKYRAPEVSFSRKYRFGEEGEFEIKAGRKLNFVGWANSSYGNLTTHVEHELEFESTIRNKHGGRIKEVVQTIETETEIKVKSYSKLVLAIESYESVYPLKLKIETDLKDDLAHSTKTEFSNEKKDRSNVILPYGIFYSNLENKQESKSAMVVQGLDVVSGEANTKQEYSYRDERGCYIRSVVAREGLLLEDSSSSVCLGVEKE